MLPMLDRFLLTAAAVAALLTPALAATTDAARAAADGRWYVLQDAGGTPCYAANRLPGPDEARLAGAFASEQEADAAISRIAQCESNNVQPGKGGGLQSAS